MLAAASIKVMDALFMLYSDSPREMMQNGLNESFWDAHGVEIGPCANFDPKSRNPRNFLGSVIFACPDLDAKSVSEALV